jgi:hypothetical protein
MEYKFKIEIGDPSKDGHNQSEDRVIISNKTRDQVREAYNKSCLLTGLVFTSNKDIIVNNEKLNWQNNEYSDRSICTEYESYDTSELAQNILKEYGIKNPEIDGDIDSLVDIFLEFIKLSLPDFEYDIVQDIIPSLGLTIGYGLFE